MANKHLKKMYPNVLSSDSQNGEQNIGIYY